MIPKPRVCLFGEHVGVFLKDLIGIILDKVLLVSASLGGIDVQIVFLLGGEGDI